MTTNGKSDASLCFESPYKCILTASARNRRRCFRLCNNPRPSSLVRPQARFCRLGGVHPYPSEGRQKRRQRGAGLRAGQGPFPAQPKPQNGVPGCPRAHALQPHGAARYSTLYRPDNRTRKCPARLVGAGHFSWAGKPPQRQSAGFHSSFLAAGSIWQGGM